MCLRPYFRLMVPLNMTHLHCLQHSLFEHLFNLYYISIPVFFMPNVQISHRSRHRLFRVCQDKQRNVQHKLKLKINLCVVIIIVVNVCIVYK